MKVIAFGHRMRVGKDTATRFALGILRPMGVTCERLSFGDEIKARALDLFAWAGLQDGVYYENHPKEKDAPLPIGKSPRQIWIEVGMKMREITPQIWPELAFAKASTDVAVISDFRHPVELDYIRAYQSMTVKIVRDAAPFQNDGIDDALEGYDCWDHVIFNNGSLRDLNTRVKALLETFI